MPSLFDPPRVTAKMRGWAGGVNIRDAVNLVAPNEARLLENMVLDERGGATKRSGCESHQDFGSGSDRVLSTYTFYRGASAPQVLIHTTAGKLYYTNDAEANPITWTQIATGLSVSVPFSYETFLGRVYMGNGVDDYRKWDGTTQTTFAAAPKGKFHRLWKDTMWISGGTPDRVYSSAPGDPETFPAPNFVDIGKGDGDDVKALATDGQFLVVGKRDRTFTIYDPVTFANRVLDNEKGFESHFAVVQSEGTIYFLSRRGICQYLGDSPSVVISAKIDPLFSDELLAIDKMSQAVGFSFDTRVMFALTEVGQTRNNLVIDYYPRLTDSQSGVGAFAFHRIPIHCYTRVRSSGTDLLYGGHWSDNTFLKVFADIGTDDTDTFIGTLETAAFDLGDPHVTKYLSTLRLLVAGAFNCFILRDFRPELYRTIPFSAVEGSDIWSTSDVWGSGVWGTFDPRVQDIRKNVDAYARYFTFRFQDASDTDTGFKQVPVGATLKNIVSGEWSIYGLVLEGKRMGVRS